MQKEGGLDSILDTVRCQMHLRDGKRRLQTVLRQTGVAEVVGRRPKSQKSKMLQQHRNSIFASQTVCRCKASAI